MEAQTSHQYQRFVRSKREAERAWLDHKRTLLDVDQQLKKGRLQDTIRWKERKTEELLASKEDRKVGSGETLHVSSVKWFTDFKV